MKKEKARLQQLRAMPYNEYLQTPEWQRTRRLALKRAGDRCQECDADGVNLEVYHTNGDNLGCEQESDVIVICEACYNRLSGEGGTSLEVPNLSFKHRATVFTSTALVGMGLPALFHAPLPAEAGGLLVAILLAVKCPQIYAATKGRLPAPLVEFIDSRAEQRELRRQSGEWSVVDRILGRHLRSTDDDDDGVLSDEDFEASLRTMGLDEKDIADYMGEQYVGVQKEHMVDPPQTSNLPQKAVTIGHYAGDNPKLRLDLASNFLPDINMVLKEGIFATGVKGSGKTGVLARIIEQIVRVAASVERRGIPLVVFDKEGDLQSLLEIFPNGCIADADHWYTAEQIVTGRLQVIVNLQAWLKAEDQARAMAMLVTELIAYTSSQNPKDRFPCPVFLDEGQYWLPEESVSYLSRDVRKTLLDAFGVLLETGRKRGLTPFIFTQRIAQVDKSVISMGVQIFMRQVIDNDHKRCMEYIRSDMVKDKKDLAALAEGEAFVCLPKGVQIRTQFKERQSIHLSHAPTVDRIGTGDTSTHTEQLTAHDPQPVATQGLPLDSIIALHSTQRINDQQFYTLISQSLVSEVGTMQNRISTSDTTSLSASDMGEVVTTELRTAKSDRNLSTGGTKWNRSGAPLRQISERERRIGELFFGPRKLNPAAIMKEVFPEARGGDAYQKAAAEVADAIRAYSETIQTEA
jgi:hypothetical protein